MKISQAEARRLKRRVREMEDEQHRQRNVWSADYPGGTHILTMFGTTDSAIATIRTAQTLKHTVVVKPEAGKLLFYALPQAEGVSP